MPALSDLEIYEALERKELSISPLIADNLQPGSIDLTLHDEIDVFNGSQVLDLSTKQDPGALMNKQSITEAGYELKPGAFVTGWSAESIKLPSWINGLLANRNSLVRWGLDAAVSCYINPGFSGRKTIVIRNFGQVPLVIKAGMRICQLVLFRLGTAAERSYEQRHDAGRLKDLFKERLQADFSAKHLDTTGAARRSGVLSGRVPKYEVNLYYHLLGKNWYFSVGPGMACERSEQAFPGPTHPQIF